MKSDIDKWLKKDGEIMLKGIGIKEGQIVLEFGCGEGYYTIPAAKVVGKRGKVYAIEKEKDVLDKLMRLARSEGLENIHPMKTAGKLKIDLGDESVDVVLLYDVLHYLEKRREIYQEVYRILKPDGFISVYPKHHISDEPLWKLANLRLEEVIKEIENAKFYLGKKSLQKLIHDNNYTRGYVLIFWKKNTKNE